MAETKLQLTNATIRKQKLDKILNLIKTEPIIIPNLPKVIDETSPLFPPIVKNEIVLPANLDISTPDTSSPVDSDNSSNPFTCHSTPTPTPTTTSTSSSKDDDAVFEIPQSIRFPVNRNNHFPSETVYCKWASCGLEFESNGKLLDHLKVN